MSAYEYNFPSIPLAEIEAKIRLRQRDTVIVELTNENYTLLSYGAKHPTNGQNKPFKLKEFKLDQFMSVKAKGEKDGASHKIGIFTKEKVIELANREGDWNKYDIPLHPSDSSYLRAQVFKGSLPDPQSHLVEVQKRFFWMQDSLPDDQLADWFLSECCGSPQIEPDGTKPLRCEVCGNSLLGFPLRNHSALDCIFYLKLKPMELMKFMSINLHSFCPKCGSRSGSHTDEECLKHQKKCQNCQKDDHQVYQKLCHLDDQHPTSIHEQKKAVTTFRREHLRHVQKLAKEGQLEYPISTDVSNDFVQRNVYKQRKLIQGWGVYEDSYGVYARKAAPYQLYKRQIIYTGLVSIEESSGWVNPYPLFDMDDIIELERVSMCIDYLRFGQESFVNRRGGDKILLMPTDNSKREQIHRATTGPPRRRIPRNPLPQNAADVTQQPQQHMATPSQTLQEEITAETGEKASHDDTIHSEASVETVIYRPAPQITKPAPHSIDSKKEHEFDKHELSKWFFTKGVQLESEEAEIQNERSSADSCIPTIQFESETGKMMTPTQVLHDASSWTLPKSTPALRRRITILSAILDRTGRVPMLNGYDNDTLADFARFLQGTIGFLADLQAEGIAPPITITGCKHRALQSLHSHEFTVPTLKLFASDPAIFFEYAELHWDAIKEKYQTCECNCFIHPENQ
ncbi:unnamed protein product [Caenorhabditis brenneri]